MATIQIAARPDALDGCFATWAETEAANAIRSDMDLAGFTKTRRRTTYAALLIDATVMLPAALYQDVRDWYTINCASGTIPTRIKRPQDNAEIVARFSGPPSIAWPTQERVAFTVTCKFEQLPQWRGL